MAVEDALMIVKDIKDNLRTHHGFVMHEMNTHQWENGEFGIFMF